MRFNPTDYKSTKFTFHITLNPEHPHPETPSASADELFEALAHADLPEWVWSVDGVEP